MGTGRLNLGTSYMRMRSMPIKRMSESVTKLLQDFSDAKNVNGFLMLSRFGIYLGNTRNPKGTMNM